MLRRHLPRKQRTAPGLSVQPVGVDWQGEEALPVYVRAPSADCPAANALRQEGIPHELLLEADEPEMWKALRNVWQLGSGFIFLEHDNVPWPGALGDLCRCRRSDWCGHWYPLGGPGQLAPGIGCWRVTTYLVRSRPELWRKWEGAPWWGLDAAVTAALSEATGWDHYHLHWPAVAHARPPGGDALGRYSEQTS
jgi:hypothetical protein